MNGRVKVWVRACLVAALASLASCSWTHRGATKCREPSLPAGLANGSGLKVPAGLDPMDAHGAVRIPDLAEPEQPRGKKDPCLSAPPSYRTGQP